MAIRKVYAPYSTTGEQVGQTPVEGYVDVKQEITPIILTGELGKDGEWSGVTVSDKNFTIDATHEGVANGASVLSPQTADASFIDMTGYTTLFIALKPSNGGNVSLVGVMGLDTRPFANLTPIEPNAVLKGLINPSASQTTLENLLFDSSESLTADVWNIFIIGDRFQNQKNLQIRIGNNSGDISNIDFAYQRVV